MKLSCSDFTGGWTAPSEPALVAAAALDDSDTSLARVPDVPEVPPSRPSVEALTDALGPLFDRTDEIPALPFSMIDSPTAYMLVPERS